MGLPIAAPSTWHTWLAYQIWWSWLHLTRQNLSTWSQPLPQLTTVLAVSDFPVETALASPSLEITRAFLLRSDPGHHVFWPCSLSLRKLIWCLALFVILSAPRNPECFIITWTDWKGENPSGGHSSCHTWLRVHCPKLCGSTTLPPWAWPLGHSGRCEVLQALGQGSHQEVGWWTWGTHHHCRRICWRIFSPCGALSLSRRLAWWRAQGELHFRTILYLDCIGNLRDERIGVVCRGKLRCHLLVWRLCPPHVHSAKTYFPWVTILQWRPMVLPDRYIDHGAPQDQMDEAGLSAKHIAATVLTVLGRSREAIHLSTNMWVAPSISMTSANTSASLPTVLNHPTSHLGQIFAACQLCLHPFFQNMYSVSGYDIQKWSCTT